MIIEREVHTKNVGIDNDLQFVYMTICPEYESAYKINNLNESGLDKENYRRKGVYFPKEYDKHQDLSNLFNYITYDVDEIIQNITILTSSETSPRFDINFDGSNVSDHIDITTKYWPTLGRCYSIQPQLHILWLGVHTISIHTRMDVGISFGYPGQFMHTDSTSKVLPLFKVTFSNFNTVL